MIYQLIIRLRKALKGADPGSLSAEAFTKLDNKVKKILSDMFVDMSTTAAERLGTIKSANMLNEINTTNEGGVRYRNGEYWQPDMSKTERSEVRSLAKNEVNKTDNYLGIGSKWLYNNQKGHEYFALYSSIDSDNPTIMYACKGNRAKTHYNHLMTALQWEEDIRGSINGGSKPIIGLLNGIESLISREIQYPGSAVGTGSNNGNASVHSRNKRIRLDKAFINCIRNIEEVQQQYGIDDHYQFAVDRGDMKTAQRMVDEAAKDAGYSVKAWHGTPIKGITVFDPKKIGSTTDEGIFGNGFYFTTSKITADGYATDRGATMPVFLGVGKSWWGLGHSIPEVAKLLNLDESVLTVRRTAMGSVVAPLPKYAKTFSAHLIEKGYDSVIIQHNANNYEVVIFNNTRIKSADPVTYDDEGNVIPLSERFNSEKKDIRYRLAAGPDLSARTLLTDPTVEGKNDAQKLNLQRYRDAVAKADGLEAHRKDVQKRYDAMTDMEGYMKNRTAFVAQCGS